MATAPTAQAMCASELTPAFFDSFSYLPSPAVLHYSSWLVRDRSERQVLKALQLFSHCNITITLFLPVPPIPTPYQSWGLGLEFPKFSVSHESGNNPQSVPQLDILCSYQRPLHISVTSRSLPQPSHCKTNPPGEQGEEIIYYHANVPLMGNEANRRSWICCVRLKCL